MNDFVLSREMHFEASHSLNNETTEILYSPYLVWIGRKISTKM